MAKAIPGWGRKLFAFAPESLFAFSPESCSSSPRKAFRDHPGIRVRLGPESASEISWQLSHIVLLADRAHAKSVRALVHEITTVRSDGLFDQFHHGRESCLPNVLIISASG